jgi:hypothetical protein
MIDMKYSSPAWPEALDTVLSEMPEILSNDREVEFLECLPLILQESPLL